MTVNNIPQQLSVPPPPIFELSYTITDKRLKSRGNSEMHGIPDLNTGIAISAVSSKLYKYTLSSSMISTLSLQRFVNGRRCEIFLQEGLGKKNKNKT